MRETGRGGAQAPKTVVNSVVHGVAILRYLGDTPGAHGVTAIATALGLSASSCFNILRTLTAEELVEFDPKKKTYTLGLGLFEIGRRAISRSGAFGFARPRMREMVEQYGLTGGFWRVAPGGAFILIGVVESEAEARIHFVTGQRVPCFAGALGRCFASASAAGPADIEAALQKLPPQNIPSLADYLVEVEEVKLRGWAIDANMFRQGVTSVAAPVVDEDGDMRYALSFSMFSSQHSPAIIDRIGRETREVGLSLSTRVFGSRQAA